MGVDAAHARVERFDVVGARRHRRAEPGNIRRELREIGAEIAENVDAQGEKPALLVERHLGGGDVVAALRVADEMLGPVGLPAHGSPQAPRGFENERIFAIDEALGAEAAADVLGDDAQLVRRDLQHAFGDEIAQPVRALAARVQG